MPFRAVAGHTNKKTGKLAKVTKADFPANRGFSPREIKVVKTQGNSTSANRFMVTNTMDYNHGLATLTIEYDQGKVSKASVKSIDMSQKSADVIFERLDIQRAYDVVVMEKDGVEYAIVSDDNQDWRDPYYRAMHEAPMFVHTSPFGPPTPVGGSASAKTVVVGGQLGVIRDPFGKAEFLGATAPQANPNWITSTNTGYRSLSLLGNTLYVGVTGGQSSAPVAFDANKLIEEAVAHAERNGDKRLRVSIGKAAPKEAPPLSVTPTVVSQPARRSRPLDRKSAGRSPSPMTSVRERLSSRRLRLQAPLRKWVLSGLATSMHSTWPKRCRNSAKERTPLHSSFKKWLESATKTQPISGRQREGRLPWRSRMGTWKS